MRKLFLSVALLAIVTPALAAPASTDRSSGTWKLNVARSSGPEVPTPEQLVSVRDGSNQVITVTGSTPDGSPLVTKFSVPVAGGPGTILEAAPFTAVWAKNAADGAEELSMLINGNLAMTVRSVFSADGKTMTSTRNVLSGPMKHGTYIDVWELQ